jgi:hypothetical protein
VIIHHKVKAAALSTRSVPVLSVVAAGVWASIAYTTAADWATPDPGTLGLVFAYFGGLVGSAFAIANDIDYFQKRYSKRLHKNTCVRKLITAKVNNDTGKVDIYEEENTMLGDQRLGGSKKRLDSFKPDAADEIHQFVSENRERLSEPDLSEAKAIVKAINGG